MIAQIKYRLHKRKYRLRYKMLQQLLQHQSLSYDQLRDKRHQDLVGVVGFASAHCDFIKQVRRFVTGQS